MEDKIFNRVAEHYKEGCDRFTNNRVVACALHGSQNYHLDFPTSDVDTKIITTTDFIDIVKNKPPVNEIVTMDNKEQITFKDIRLYIESLRKQNINFVETLFTDWYITNPTYHYQWKRLIYKREAIARLNEYQALRTMIGVTRSEYKRMTKAPAEGDDVKTYYDSDGAIRSINELGYNPKAYASVCRVSEFISSYIAGWDYKECLVPSNIDFIRRAKQGAFPKEAAIEHAKSIMETIDMCEANILPKYFNVENKETLGFLEDVVYEIMKTSMREELLN